MFDDFANKEFRDAFLEENIKTRLALQVRALREKAKWSQPELGERAGKTQSGISRIEDPNYGKFTIRTLLDLASAFDVALFISFVSYSKLITEIDDVSPEALAVANYKEEKKALEESLQDSVVINVPAGQLHIPGHAPAVTANAAVRSQNTTINKTELPRAAAQAQAASTISQKQIRPHRLDVDDLINSQLSGNFPTQRSQQAMEYRI